jgi:hypothetical protein
MRSSQNASAKRGCPPPGPLPRGDKRPVAQRAFEHRQVRSPEGSRVNNLASNILRFIVNACKSALGSVDLLSADTFGMCSSIGQRSMEDGLLKFLANFGQTEMSDITRSPFSNRCYGVAMGLLSGTRGQNPVSKISCLRSILRGMICIGEEIEFCQISEF